MDINFQTIKLSRRNLEVLLSKLNRTRDGTDPSMCTLRKCINKDKNDEQPVFVYIQAVENEGHYDVHSPGIAAEVDEANVDKIGEEF